MIVGSKRVYEAETIKPSLREMRLESELHKVKDMNSEIMSENVELKKGLKGWRITGNYPGGRCTLKCTGWWKRAKGEAAGL